MRRLFADAFYWIALLHAGDQWHQRVIAFTATLGVHHLYTTDAVFDEYLAAYATGELKPAEQVFAEMQARYGLHA